ncbi:hypothetical protein N665_0014s0145 [Sinapis alba]|nr:hypothetical protein N665_0014s0145 [Sinapis alba]
MEYILATRDRTELVELTKTVHRMGLSGEHGTWKEFLKFHDPRSAYKCSDPDSWSDPALLQFLTSLNKKDDLRKLALLLNPSRPLVCDYSYKYPKETPEQRLVRKTLTHDEYPFDFLIPYNSKDWLLTGIIGSPLRVPISRHAPIISYSFRSSMPLDITKTDMIAVCCEKVLCEGNTEAAVRVAAVDRNCKVILDELVKPNQPVINYRTSVTGLDSRALYLSNATPLSDIQEKLLGLFPTETIMVGHLLNKDLKALKMDHARVIDTSLLFKYEISGCIEKLPRPSLDHLCKSVLGYEMLKSPGRCVHEAVASMKLVLAILEHGAHTSVPLPDEMLKTDDESRPSPKEKNVLSKQRVRNLASPLGCKPSWKAAFVRAKIQQVKNKLIK